VNSNPVPGEMHSIQHYVIKFVGDLPQVAGFLRVLRFHPPIKWPPRYNWNIVERGAKHYKQTNKQANKQTNMLIYIHAIYCWYCIIVLFVFRFVYPMLCCQFLWIVHLWFPLWYSLTSINYFRASVWLHQTTLFDVVYHVNCHKVDVLLIRIKLEMVTLL
jgi:hypothetical protein